MAKANNISPKNTIYNYFVQKKNSNAARNENFAENVPKMISLSAEFYKACLNEQIDSCKNSECLRKKNLLKKQVDEMKEKCRDVEDAIRICDSVMLDKDIKIKSLEQEIKVACAVDSNVDPKNSASATQSFGGFSMHFSSEKLATLRSIGNNKREDSTFVSAIIKTLYADRLDAIKYKSVTGRSKGEKKEAITPEKREILNEMFTERIYSTTDDNEERKIRLKKINDHIRFGLLNIGKKIQSESVEKSVMHRLAE